MKLLTVCDGGNVRSHAMMVTCKEHGHESIAVGRGNLSTGSMDYMCEWADVVVLMEPHMKENIPERFHDKIYNIDVGPDVYGVGINPELREKCREGARYMHFHFNGKWK